VWLACRPFAFRAAAFQMLRVRSRSPGNAVRSLSSPCHGRAPSARRARDAGPYARRKEQRACQATPGGGNHRVPRAYASAPPGSLRDWSLACNQRQPTRCRRVGRVVSPAASGG
jgi:hypothetical protein